MRSDGMTRSRPPLVAALTFALVASVSASPGLGQTRSSAGPPQVQWEEIAMCRVRSMEIVIWEAAANGLTCRLDGTDLNFAFLSVPAADADRGRTFVSKIAGSIGIHVLPGGYTGWPTDLRRDIYDYDGNLLAFPFPRCSKVLLPDITQRKFDPGESYGDWCLDNFVDTPAVTFWEGPVARFDHGIGGAVDQIVSKLDTPEAEDVLARDDMQSDSAEPLEPKTLSGAVAVIYLDHSEQVPPPPSQLSPPGLPRWITSAADAVLRRIVDGHTATDQDDLSRGIALMALAKGAPNLNERIRLLRRAVRVSTSSSAFLDLEATLRICYALLGLGKPKEAQAEASSGIRRCSKLEGYFSLALLRAMARDPGLFFYGVRSSNGWGNDLNGAPAPGGGWYRPRPRAPG